MTDAKPLEIRITKTDDHNFLEVEIKPHVGVISHL